MMGTQCANVNGNGTFYWELWNSGASGTSCGAWESNYESPLPTCGGLLDGNWHKVTVVLSLNHDRTNPTYTFQHLYVDGTDQLNGIPVMYPALKENNPQTCHDSPQLRHSIPD
jgi:hypothetical protein